MTSTFSGYDSQSIFGFGVVVSFVRLDTGMFTNSRCLLTRTPRSHVRVLIYQTSTSNYIYKKKYKSDTATVINFKITFLGKNWRTAECGHSDLGSSFAPVFDSCQSRRPNRGSRKTSTFSYFDENGKKLKNRQISRFDFFAITEIYMIT